MLVLKNCAIAVMLKIVHLTQVLEKNEIKTKFNLYGKVCVGVAPIKGYFNSSNYKYSKLHF
jgi:hypothetical protein